ncbi:MAG: phage baseplate assembly protein [Alphaproteobacteria bacterium]
MPNVRLIVNGTAFEGWKSIRVTRSIETVAGTFELIASERWPGTPGGRQLLPRDRCKLMLGASLVISGRIDDVRPFHDAQNHEVSFTGRDETGRLVDCSALNEPGEWNGRFVQDIAADIARPFGIEVVLAATPGAPFKRFRLEAGETAFEAIERLCRMRRLLCTSDPSGRLVLTRAGTDRHATALVLGQNILSASGSFSSRDRFSRYMVKAQQPGGDNISPEDAAGVKAEATDPGITEYRPLLILPEQDADIEAAKQRVEWEADVRAARARRATVQVQGWRDGPDGDLWTPNRLVSIDDRFLALKREMLIAGVTFILDENGTRTELSLVLPGAFDKAPMPEPEGQDEWAI